MTDKRERDRMRLVLVDSGQMVLCERGGRSKGLGRSLALAMGMKFGVVAS